MNKVREFIQKYFIVLTSALSAIAGGLHLWIGFSDGFSLWMYVIIGMDFLYIPFAFIFKKKFFSYYYLIYSFVLVFILAFTKTYLYNNFSALFILCLVIMIDPKLEIPGLIVYFLLSCVAFGFNDEKLIKFFVHLVRSVWFVLLVIYVLSKNYQRKSLVLYDDEKKILDQLCDGKHYQKEVEGFSENTVYRKLKAARERNGNITREQLIELYRKEFKNTDKK